MNYVQIRVVIFCLDTRRAERAYRDIVFDRLSAVVALDLVLFVLILT